MLRSQDKQSLRVGKDKFDCGFASVEHALSVGVHFQTFGSRIFASGNQSAHAFHFHYANTASAKFAEFFHVAQSGNFDADAACSFQQSAAFFYAYGNIVNFEVNHVCLLLCK